MPKKKTPVARKRTPSPATPLPPVAVAIGRMVEPNSDVLNPDYVRAWQVMPSIVAAYANGTSGDIHKGATADILISDLVDEAITKSRTMEGFDKRLAEAKDLLEETDPDLWGSVYVAIEDPAFAVGLALGVYIMLNGGAR